MGVAGQPQSRRRGVPPLPSMPWRRGVVRDDRRQADHAEMCPPWTEACVRNEGRGTGKDRRLGGEGERCERGGERPLMENVSRSQDSAHRERNQKTMSKSKRHLCNHEYVQSPRRE